MLWDFRAYGQLEKHHSLLFTTIIRSIAIRNFMKSTFSLPFSTLVLFLWFVPANCAVGPFTSIINIIAEVVEHGLGVIIHIKYNYRAVIEFIQCRHSNSLERHEMKKERKNTLQRKSIRITFSWLFLLFVFPV